MPRAKDLKEGYNNFYIEPLKEYQEIADFYVDHRALPIARDIRNKSNGGINLGNSGIDYAYLGEMRKAIEHPEQAVVIARGIGDKRNENMHLGNRGLIIDKIGQREKARKKLTEWQGDD